MAPALEAEVALARLRPGDPDLNDAFADVSDVHSASALGDRVTRFEGPAPAAEQSGLRVQEG